MKDVAERAGVGLSTVSRVVSGKGGVAKAKVRAVERAVRELDYSRNDFAHTLRTGTAATIGVIVTKISDPFFSTLVGAIETAAQKRDQLVLVASATDQAEEGVRVIRRVVRRRLDGLIIVAPEEADLSFLKRELDAGTPLVFVDRPPLHVFRDAVDTVLVDNQRGAADAVVHLSQAGHSRIACLAHVAGRFTSEQRQAGYARGLHEAGLAWDPALVVMIEDDVESCVEALVELQKLPHPPTAVFTTNSRTTKVTLEAFRLLDFHPAIVAFDDFDLATLMVPPTTTIAQDPRSIGEVAAELLFDRIGGFAGASRRVVLDTRLIERGSGESPPPSSHG